MKSVKRVRKISETGAGAKLLNLKGLIPENWEYVEVEKVEDKGDEVLLKISVLKVLDDESTIPTKI